MGVIADILLGAGAIGAAAYCMVLARRLAAFTRLEGGMGGAIAVLSAQVDDMTGALRRADQAAGQSASTLDALTSRAETAAARLEIILATLHDLPAAATPGHAVARPRPVAAPPVAESGGRRLRVVRRRMAGEAA